jgi:hypothetical protein
VLIVIPDVVAVDAELSVTRTVTVTDSDVEGLPEIMPELESSEKPVGRVPVAIEN